MIKIHRAQNGFVLTYPEDNEFGVEEKFIAIEEIYNHKVEDEHYSEQVAFTRLCHELAEALGIFNSKHHKYRFNIEMEQQHGDEESVGLPSQ